MHTVISTMILAIYQIEKDSSRCFCNFVMNLSFKTEKNKCRFCSLNVLQCKLVSTENHFIVVSTDFDHNARPGECRKKIMTLIVIHTWCSPVCRWCPNSQTSFVSFSHLFPQERAFDLTWEHSSTATWRTSTTGDLKSTRNDSQNPWLVTHALLV